MSEKYMNIAYALRSLVVIASFVTLAGCDSKPMTIEEQFEGSYRVMFDDNFSELTTNDQAKMGISDDGTLEIEATDRDPMLVFPVLPIESGGKYVVKVEVWSEFDGMAQLFYSKDGGAEGARFSEAASIRKQIMKGDNTLYYLLDDNDLGKWIRFDPNNRPGRLVIQRFTVKRI
ncbi:hypothetical protein [Simiduia agarivorans]|uniref:Lipoprotein n=1 Tax=Simiduia agarivorans (strain DSM 21679 / JCM 13881 / BCRC 17597 / SA1) TaxID=1117647 RepID=K4KFN3_SIMAS|nr:hypothetical protein [Simiduia agarivorans]AFU97741.1 hypothetical protein M5M_02610 [Simiduia agarivorans SA1 = DSM 21679]